MRAILVVVANMLGEQAFQVTKIGGGVITEQVWRGC
jgi:hypothetical protein